MKQQLQSISDEKCDERKRKQKAKMRREKKNAAETPKKGKSPPISKDTTTTTGVEKKCMQRSIDIDAGQETMGTESTLYINS